MCNEEQIFTLYIEKWKYHMPTLFGGLAIELIFNIIMNIQYVILDGVLEANTALDSIIIVKLYNVRGGEDVQCILQAYSWLDNVDS